MNAFGIPIHFDGVGLAVVMLGFLALVKFGPQLYKPSLFTRGYDYAVAELRTGRKTPYDLEFEIMGGGDRNDFDHGIEAAIEDLVRTHHIKDNRMHP